MEWKFLRNKEKHFRIGNKFGCVEKLFAQREEMLFIGIQMVDQI